MKLQALIKTYADQFESKTRENGETFVCLKHVVYGELSDAVREAHGYLLPHDWVFSTFSQLLSRMSDYEVESLEDLEEYRSEIVESCVDSYTHELTKWLASSNYFPEYLTEVLEELEPKDGFALLQQAQYRAIDEIYGHIADLLESQGEA
jgi:hypothetical protein